MSDLEPRLTDSNCPTCGQGAGDKPDSGHCYLCCEDITPGDPESLLDHGRLIHPDQYGDGPERWPDGGLVYTDETDYTADEAQRSGGDQ
jgi:hypothetical protein